MNASPERLPPYPQKLPGLAHPLMGCPRSKSGVSVWCYWGAIRLTILCVNVRRNYYKL
jgi:hypothetical protein